LSSDYGFITELELYWTTQLLAGFRDDELSLVHKDAYSENLLVDANDPTSVLSIVDLEHVEFSGIGQDFYALTMFYFPRMLDSEIETFFWQRYAEKSGKSIGYYEINC